MSIWPLDFFTNHCELGDVRNFQMGERQYDLILASFVLHFLEEDEERIALTKINNALKDDGIFYMSVNTLENDTITQEEGIKKMGKYKFIKDDGEKYVLYDLDRLINSLSQFEIINELSDLSSKKAFEVYCRKLMP